MRWIVLALVLTSVASADAAGRPHRRRHTSKALKQALRGAARKPASPIGAPGDGHQLVVERGQLHLDVPPARHTERAAVALLPRSSPQATLALTLPTDRGALGTELPPPLVLARW